MDNNKMPDDFHAITPMLAIKEASAAIEWYKKVFNAEEVMRLADANGVVAHAQLKINGSLIMIAEEHPDYNRSPDTLNGTSVILNLHVPDVDAVVDKAKQEGAVEIFPVKDQFYGDRSGRIQDPYGHMWIVSTRIKEVSPQEMQKLFEASMKNG